MRGQFKAKKGGLFDRNFQAIERLGFMQEANLNSLKTNNRTQWISIVKESLEVIKLEHFQMYKEFIRLLIPNHDYLYEGGYKFRSKSETELFFNKFISKRVETFEQMSAEFVNLGCYQNQSQSYSFTSFKFIILAMVNIDECYAEFLSDLESLYFLELNKSDREILDPKIYLELRNQYTSDKRYGREFNYHKIGKILI